MGLKAWRRGIDRVRFEWHRRSDAPVSKELSGSRCHHGGSNCLQINMLRPACPAASPRHLQSHYVGGLLSRKEVTFDRREGGLSAGATALHQRISAESVTKTP